MICISLHEIQLHSTKPSNKFDDSALFLQCLCIMFDNKLLHPPKGVHHKI
jgi:hypothetical protein